LFGIFLKMKVAPTARLRRLTRNLVLWKSFWATIKVALIAILIAGIYGSDKLFNIAVLLLVLEILIEVMCESFMSARVFEKLYVGMANASMVHLTGRAAERRLQLQDFLGKIYGQIKFIYRYGIVILGMSVAVIILFSVFDGMIPYSWIIYSVYLLTWPSFCIGPLLLFKETAIKSMSLSNPEVSDSGQQMQLTNNDKSLLKYEATPTFVPKRFASSVPFLASRKPSADSIKVWT